MNNTTDFVSDCTDRYNTRIHKVSKVINSCISHDQLVNAERYKCLYIRDVHKCHPEIAFLEEMVLDELLDVKRINVILGKIKD